MIKVETQNGDSNNDMSFDFSFFKMESLGLNFPHVASNNNNPPQQHVQDPGTPSYMSDMCSSVSSLTSWGSTLSLSSPSSIGSVSTDDGPITTWNKTSNTKCEVCGDKSTGKHYGIYTCEGCKSFFKRTIRRNLTYTCRLNNKCKVDKHHRNQCQQCRMNKCYKVGMKKEAVQRGRQKQNTKIPSDDKQQQQQQQQQQQKQNVDSTLISQLMGAEPIQLEEEQQTVPATSTTEFDNIVLKASTELFNTTQWAKNIPFFQNLSLNDQLSLMKLSWKELFIMNLIKTNFSVRITDMICANIDGKPQYGGTFCDHVKALQIQMDRLVALDIDPVELVCLKALILFSPDSPGLTNPSSVQNIQEKVLSTLEAYSMTRVPYQACRFGKLMLRISALRTINPVLITQLFFTWSFGRLPVDGLIQILLTDNYNININNNNNNINNNSNNDDDNNNNIFMKMISENHSSIKQNQLKQQVTYNDIDNNNCNLMNNSIYHDFTKSI